MDCPNCGAKTTVFETTCFNNGVAKHRKGGSRKPLTDDFKEPHVVRRRRCINQLCSKRFKTVERVFP